MNDNPTIYMIGNAHVDPAWMWRIEEGMEAFIATCRSALDRISETGEFIFTCSSAAHYEYLRDADPELFSRIKQAVRAHRWAVVGGWWVEADCNLPSGEGFARQALYGQGFFIREFGKACTVGYCVDSFGHNANLPQLLRKAGMNAYVFMRPDGSELHLEEALFRWVAPSGDHVLAYRLPLHYSNHKQSSLAKIETLRRDPEYVRHPWMLFFGVGNHGGGPTKQEIASIVAEAANDNSIRFGDPQEFFAQVQSQVVTEQFYDFQPHAIGCYSAHSEIKRLNRRAERELLVAERLGVLSECFSGQTTQYEELTRGWKNVCFNHFHDLLGGVASRAALDDAVSMYREAIAIADRHRRLAVQRIANGIKTRVDHTFHETLVIVNPTAIERDELIEFELWHPESSETGSKLRSLTVRDCEGRSVRAQAVESDTRIGGDRVRFLLRAATPALGVSTYQIIEKSADASPRMEVEIPLVVSRLLAASRALIIEDLSDTWGHGCRGFTTIDGQCNVEHLESIEHGPLRWGLRRFSSFGNSTLVEEWRWDGMLEEIDVRLRLDWHERHRMLKFSIDHQCDGPRAYYEIPYAVIERPIDRDEHPGQSWVFVEGSSGGTGLGVINDSKYSYEVNELSINLVLARSPIYAHHVPPESPSPTGTQYFQDQGEQEVHLKIILGRNWKEARMPARSQCMLEPLCSLVESAHDGGALPKLGFESSHSNLQMTVLKHAASGPPWIVRIHETHGISTHAKFRLEGLGASWEADFGPFEIKSFRLVHDRDEAVTCCEVDLVERELSS